MSESPCFLLSGLALALSAALRRCDVEAVLYVNSIVVNNGQDAAIHVTGGQKPLLAHWPLLFSQIVLLNKYPTLSILQTNCVKSSASTGALTWTAPYPDVISLSAHFVRRCAQQSLARCPHFSRQNVCSLLSSVGKQIFGLYVVKLAVLLVIVGGVPRIDPSGTRTRGESHMLLVGDPGTGKLFSHKNGSKLPLFFFFPTKHPFFLYLSQASHSS